MSDYFCDRRKPPLEVGGGCHRYADRIGFISEFSGEITDLNLTVDKIQERRIVGGFCGSCLVGCFISCTVGVCTFEARDNDWDTAKRATFKVTVLNSVKELSEAKRETKTDKEKETKNYSAFIKKLLEFFAKIFPFFFNNI